MVAGWLAGWLAFRESVSSFYVTLSSSLPSSGSQSPFCFRRVMNFGGFRDASSSDLLHPKII